MCGIVGVIGRRGDASAARAAIASLLLESETRGSEAAGVATLFSADITVAKSALSARKFVESDEFVEAFDSNSEFGAAIGHTRLVTNGSAIFGDNNQPVTEPGLVMVHNGIVVNHQQLWESSGISHPAVDVDSAALLARIATHAQGRTLSSAVISAFAELDGSASIALLASEQQELVLATNTGSLYLALDGSGHFVAFGSERPIVERFAKSPAAHDLTTITEVRQLRSGQVARVCCASGTIDFEDLEPYALSGSGHPSYAPKVGIPATRLVDEGPHRRCTRCILPETFPFIEFDDDGVCSQCHSYIPTPTPDTDRLEAELSKYRKGTGEPDCIVAFSGGRDSAFGLHRLVVDYGMQPLTLTYDWGMVTDLARRNQARLVGQLGVEQILISADIKKKRMNIQRNMKAWLARPELGMVPLLMAGDKQFFTHSARLAVESSLPVVIFCVNPLEMTFFKAGFAGVPDQRYYDSKWTDKARLLRYYGTQFVRNPRYINRSVLDSASAFRASYVTKHDYLQLFEYMPWEEDHINDTLLDTYRWETDPSTPTTWRIGDGTAAFYNWVFAETVGFTENDTFRSNQVREGTITRERALELVQNENTVRWDRIEEYFDLIELPLDPAKRVVRSLADRLAADRLVDA